VISKEEVLERARVFSLEPTVVEKDYVLGWLLHAIGNRAELAEKWIFKGGTSNCRPRGEGGQELEMAMAVHGKNRHYRWQEVRGRHWISTARKTRFCESEARDVMDEYLRGSRQGNGENLEQVGHDEPSRSRED